MPPKVYPKEEPCKCKGDIDKLLENTLVKSDKDEIIQAIQDLKDNYVEKAHFEQVIKDHKQVITNTNSKLTSL